MKGLPGSSADRFVAAVFVAGTAAFGLALGFDRVDDPSGLAAIVLLCLVTEYLTVRLYFDGAVSVSFVGVVVGIVLFGPIGGAAAATACTIGGLPMERSPRKLAFNFGQMNLAAGVASVVAFTGDSVFGSLASGPIWANSFLLVKGTIAGLFVFTITSSLVSNVMALSTGRSRTDTYRENFGWLLPHHIALGAFGGGLAVAYAEIGTWGLVVFAAPLLLSRYTMKQFIDRTRENVVRLERSNVQLKDAYVEIRDMSHQLQDAYTGTLESLVAALDMRDQETRGHSSRVAVHSYEMARTLGMKDEEELAMIYRGALMHDVGKIGVPDAILRKPGPLTEEEWEFMRKHPGFGYRILAQVPYLRPAARIVLAHHERWDGDGYPRRLKGENIPLGARIFALADTYDAIISDRPYRDGQSPDAALAEILRCAGSQFDPTVVEAFEALFPGWREEDGSAVRKPLYLPAWTKDEDEAGRAAG